MLKISNDSKLSFGLNAGYNRYQFAFNKIEFKDSEVPSQLFNNQVYGALDVNGGLYFKTKGFFAGVSATHINNPKVFVYDNGRISYRMGTHIFAMAGYSFEIKKDILFAPTVLLKLTQDQMMVDINANFFLFKKLWAGVFYRTQYGPGMLLQYYVTNKMRLGIGYDTGLQSQRRLGPSFEAMLGFDWAGNKAKMVNPRFL
jgi:type IX secretion system PorP/SprF family membrane protein